VLNGESKSYRSSCVNVLPVRVTKRDCAEYEYSSFLVCENLIVSTTGDISSVVRSLRSTTFSNVFFKLINTISNGLETVIAVDKIRDLLDPGRLYLYLRLGMPRQDEGATSSTRFGHIAQYRALRRLGA
jgi:hypothetical protein